MSIRKLGLVVAAMCAALLVVPVAAGAQTTPPSITASSLTQVPVSGTAHNGKKFTGHFTVDRFINRNGQPYAVGTLTGKLGNRSIKRSDVAIPAKVATNGLAKAAATCPILHLVLGPLTLNLLGLNVHLNQVVLDITATSGPGNLLGNLLCGVANLLNGPSLLSQVETGLLNLVNQLTSIPALLNL
jgi:hypothetical protein